jgi:Methylene-tetrahydrofolate reductase C terminal.
MIITKAKPFEEILSFVEEFHNIFIVGCNVCAAKMKTGGEPEVLELADRLEKAGHPILGWALPTAACSVQSFSHLASKNQNITNADCILVMGCGSGTSVISSITNVPVTGTNETVSLGGCLGFRPSEHLCTMCGECNIGDFSGICPNARCPKSQLNGPCGGSKNGKCEVSKEHDCIWYLIETKMETIHKLSTLSNIQKPKNYKL